MYLIVYIYFFTGVDFPGIILGSDCKEIRDSGWTGGFGEDPPTVGREPKDLGQGMLSLCTKHYYPVTSWFIDKNFLTETGEKTTVQPQKFYNISEIFLNIVFIFNPIIAVHKLGTHRWFIISCI